MSVPKRASADVGRLSSSVPKCDIFVSLNGHCHGLRAETAKDGAGLSLRTCGARGHPKRFPRKPAQRWATHGVSPSTTERAVRRAGLRERPQGRPVSPCGASARSLPHAQENGTSHARLHFCEYKWSKRRAGKVVARSHEYVIDMNCRKLLGDCAQGAVNESTNER